MRAGRPFSFPLIKGKGYSPFGDEFEFCLVMYKEICRGVDKG